MNTMSVQKPEYRNELEGIGLSVLFRSLPFFLVVAWMAKHKSGIAFFAQDGVALALATDPSMLLLDEPVSGMNATETARFMELLNKLHRRGMSILLVEHDVPMVMGVAARIVVLNYGRIIAEGPPAAIRGNPEVIRAYLGEGASRHAAH